jgi:hypothetical protein
MPEHRKSNGSVVAKPADDGTGKRTDAATAAMRVRESDLEPYVGLGYLSKLFRFIAIFLAILLIAEVATGLVAQGRGAIPTLLAEASRLIVLAGLLWGIGDLAILLIDIGHDVRATRILLGRQVAHHIVAHHADGEQHLPEPLGSRPDVGSREL